MKLRILLGVLLCFVFLFAASKRSKADTAYDVQGTMTVLGNNLCNGVCTETINFSFVWDWSAMPGGGYFSTLENCQSAIGGPLQINNCTGQSSGTGGGYFAFSGNDAEIDLQFPFQSIQSSSPIAPVFSSLPDLYECYTSVCVQDFGDQFTTAGVPVDLQNGSVIYSVSPVPEPHSWMFLGAGMIVGLLLIGANRNGIYNRLTPQRVSTAHSNT